jgi:hypothetical protein
MADRNSLTQARLHEVLRYDPLTGLFTRVAPLKGRRVGTVAGCVNSNGYVQLAVDGSLYLAHRLAWFYIHGVWPADDLDHKDTIRHHNWIKNLRVANSFQNAQNQRRAKRGSRSGLLGVSWSDGRWHANIKADGISYVLGSFSDKYEAHAVYLSAKIVLHPFHTLVDA